MNSTNTICRHCDRVIVLHEGRWIDPQATGDDVIWRETCDAHDTFTAEHEPDMDTPEHTPIAMVPRHSHLGGNFVAECPTCHFVCVYWDDEDLDEDGNLICFGG